MYQQLFARVGFAWTVRITGFVTLALGAVAVATVSSTLKTPRESAPLFDRNMFRDPTYMLVLVGSTLVCLGTYMDGASPAALARQH